METGGQHGHWEDPAGYCHPVWADIRVRGGGGQQDIGQWRGRISYYIKLHVCMSVREYAS